MKTRKVAMSLMAHPDDCEFLTAGTLALLAERGWEIHIVTLTPGDAGSATESPVAIAERRRREAARAAAVLNGRYHCLESRDLYVTFNEETLRRAIILTREIAPTLVLTHSPECYIIDHEMAARIARTASFGYMIRNVAPGPVHKDSCVPHLYYADPIDGLDPYGRVVEATTHVDISGVIGTKTRMLRAHASQRNWLRAHHGVDEYTHAMRRWSSRRGAEIGVRFAEGFRQHKGHGYPTDCILRKELGDATVRQKTSGTGILH